MTVFDAATVIDLGHSESGAGKFAGVTKSVARPEQRNLSFATLYQSCDDVRVCVLFATRWRDLCDC
jgi:hypothetical protein